MTKRKIIQIDRDLCDGCGLCTTACAEGALELDAKKKAVLVREIFCDGLGACLAVCPTGALKIVERDLPAYDARAAHAHVLRTRGPEAAQLVHGMGQSDQVADPQPSKPPRSASTSAPCPGTLARQFRPAVETDSSASTPNSSELTQWPIQLHLVSPHAPYFKGTDLLIAADCTAFSLGSFHPDLLRGKKLIIACPKLDETEGYISKLAALIKENKLHSLTVAIMTVPCCSGLYRIVEKALELSGIKIALKKKLIHIDGRLIS